MTKKIWLTLFTTLLLLAAGCSNQSATTEKETSGTKEEVEKSSRTVKCIIRPNKRIL